MHLNIRGTKHPIRPGITVIGSDKNERYNTILLQDGSICPKHASLRFDVASNKVEILDLCSERGVTVDQKPIAPLSWIEITSQNKLQLGSVLVGVESEESKNDDASFLHGEDEEDIIDCSLEETQPLQGSRKISPTAVILGTSGKPSSSTVIETKATVHRPASSLSIDDGRRSSFLVPETQQLEESRLCEVPDKTAVPAVGGGGPNELDDDDDSFFIPETQQPEDELDRMSEIIEPILPAATEAPVERTAAEEEYFQMTANDDDNSNDVMFNNKYVQESQNLMQNIDESYKHDVVEPRTSILPERSVDSISFQEHRNTTMDMSAMVWNESRKESEKAAKSGGDKAVTMPIASSVPDKVDDRSVTPDLNFDDDPLKTVETRSSVTPDIQFKDGPEATRSAETPKLGFDEPENEEISLNQEGCFKQPNDVSTESAKEANVSHVENIYEMETQPFRVEDAYDLLTQPLHLLPAAKSGSAGSHNRTSNQKEQKRELEPYDLQTQPLIIERKPSFVKSMSLTARSKSKQSPEIDYASMPTQPETPPEFASNSNRSSYGTRRSAEKAAKSLNFGGNAKPSLAGRSKNAAAKSPTPDIDYADLPTQPETPPEPALRSGIIDRMPSSTSAIQIDDDDLLTQPLSPPKAMLDTPAVDRDCVRKVNTSASRNPYNLDTEPLSLSPYGGKEKWEKKKKLFVKLEDIKKSRRISKSCENPYFMSTQPMPKAAAENAYDLDTQLLPENVTLPEGEVSQFNPQINSTTVQQQRGKLSIQQQQQAMEVSPSTSNKENRTADADRTTDDSSGTDDEFGLSDTIPIGALFNRKPVNVATAARELPVKSKFKVPLSRTETAATPKAKLHRKRHSVEMSEFLTPEHPGVYLPKVECIRSVSDRIATSSSLASKSKPTYHFNDSSSSSSEDESVRNVFKKTNVSVVLEKELEKVRVDGVLKKQEKRTARQLQIRSDDDQSETGESKAGGDRSDKKPALRDAEPLERKSSRRREMEKAKSSEVEKKSSRTAGKREEEKEAKAKGKDAESAERKSSSRRSEMEQDKGVEGETKYKRTTDRKEEKQDRHKKSEKLSTILENDRRERRPEKEKELKEKPSSRRREEEKEKDSDIAKKAKRTTTTDKKEHKDDNKKSRQSEKLGERSDTRASAERAKPSDDDRVRVSKRIRHKAYKMKLLEESVDYQLEAEDAAAATDARSTRTTRKRKDQTSTDREEPIARISESKRPKSGHRQRSSSTSSTVAPEAGRRDRLQSTASDTRKKVVEIAADLVVGHGVTSGGSSGGDGLLGNVSVTSSTASDDSAVAGRSIRPRLIFTRMSPEPYRKCIARAGGKIVDIPELATILVTDRIIRTYKFLCAVAKGIPIVGQSYLDALQRSEANEQINPWDHILSDPDTEKRYKFRLRDTLLKARKHKLFEDYTVFVTASTKPPPSELFLILTCAGAKASKHCNQPSVAGGKAFVISDPADAASWARYRERLPGIEIVSAEGFMLSIMQHSKNFQKHHLM
ncbi:mediator of DNA damage checkpoint protein 1-like isoform X1 [Anopheles arabiensis]|uniref:mediator of DNA damage checkpoint protein 1-like isoform X1 n=1 Tax=Anopheles arabiensis TaxID=7173 RepID=UPI001AAD3555|nr:mediator of DNA damage checkpoint protein 1-like isoform X1 [Anopheles arabiensis]